MSESVSSAPASSADDKKKKEKKESSDKKDKKDKEEKKEKKDKESKDGDKKEHKHRHSHHDKDKDGKKDKKDDDKKDKESKDGDKKEHKHRHHHHHHDKDKDDKDKDSSKKKRSKRVLAGGENFEDRYDLGDELGRGAFSVVRKCTDKTSGEHFAVKFVEKKNVGSDMVRLQTEIDILKRVKHPNIINLKEVFETDDYIYIVTELVTGGELFDKIVELGAYSEADAAKLVHKMVSAIDYLHSQGIVHRDLKPENLLIKDDKDISEVKIADFGLSKIVAQKVMMQTACGTPGYVAPEVLNATGYDKEVDLWSIGVITYILLCGFPPFYNESLPLLFEQIMTADYDYPEEYWDEISDNAKNFIDKLLVVDPAQRMTAKDALNHPWLAGVVPDKKLTKFNKKMDAYVKGYKKSSKSASDKK